MSVLPSSLRNAIPTSVPPLRPAPVERSEARFASLLSDLGDHNTGGPPPRERAPGGVADEVAHIFNAFGFFPAGAADCEAGHNSTASQAEAQFSKDDVASVSVAPLSAPEATEGGRSHDQPVLPAATAEVDTWLSVEASASTGQGSTKAGQLQSPAGQLELHPACKGSEIAPPAKRQAVNKALQHSGAAPSRSLSPEPGREPAGTGKNGNASPTPRQNRCERGDRLLFQVGLHSVELIGRLAELGEDEKKRLLDALAGLLETHGLTLGAATINGQPITQTLATRMI